MYLYINYILIIAIYKHMALNTNIHYNLQTELRNSMLVGIQTINMSPCPDKHD